MLKNLHESDYDRLRAALIEGYASIREIDPTELDLFLLLRSATYVGWIMSRMKEDGAQERRSRFIRLTRDLAKSYL